MIPLLPQAAWLEFRGAPETTGQNHTTHQAVILDTLGAQHKCFVKASPPGFPMVYAEAIAWMVAGQLNLPRPKFAALIDLPMHRVRQCMRLDQHWMRYPSVLAFCSSAVSGKHITSRWNWLSHIRAAKAFKHEDVARIAAFDMWVENQDRHTGNFLRTSTGDYIPIDNELILYTVFWVASGFTYVHNGLVDQARKVLKADGVKGFESAVVEASLAHQQAFSNVAPLLQRFITMVIADPVLGNAKAQEVLNFLQLRADPDWLRKELGYIA
jgi:Phosphatidylinositol 3- and 4-kinase